MELVGLQTDHVWVSDNCRDIHGEEEAFEIALQRLRVTYRATLSARKKNGCDRNTTYHLGLTVEEVT